SSGVVKKLLTGLLRFLACPIEYVLGLLLRRSENLFLFFFTFGNNPTDPVACFIDDVAGFGAACLQFLLTLQLGISDDLVGPCFGGKYGFLGLVFCCGSNFRLEAC